ALTVRLPDPEASDTLAVAMANGEPEKESVVKLDLGARGMTHATTLSSFVLTMAEDFPGGKNETDDEKNPDLQSEYNVTGPGGPRGAVVAGELPPPAARQPEDSERRVRRDEIQDDVRCPGDRALPGPGRRIGWGCRAPTAATIGLGRHRPRPELRLHGGAGPG